jgi:hypothetical protein
VQVRFVGNQDHLRGTAGQKDSSECQMHTDGGT